MSDSANLPLVSVVSVYYNRANCIEESLSSLISQTYTNLEIIAVDDGSTDETWTILRKFESDPRVRVLHHENIGFTKSIRQAVEMARGQFVAIHGSGDVSLPRRIEKQVEVLLRNRDVGVVGCFQEIRFTRSDNWTIMRPVISEPLFDKLLQCNVFGHGEVMFRRSVYDRVGGYRTPFVHAQDYDLWLRMSFVTNFYIIPEILYISFRRTDGANVNVSKAMLLKYLAAFARQCALERKCRGTDWIDEYGAEGLVFKARSKWCAAALARGAIIAAIDGAWDDAKILSNASFREALTFKNIVAASIIILHRLIPSFVEVGLKRIYTFRSRRKAGGVYREVGSSVGSYVGD